MSTRQTIAILTTVIIELALSTTLGGFAVPLVFAQGGNNVSIVLGASTLADKVGHQIQSM